MTKEELAAQLNGSEYPIRLSHAVVSAAKASGLLIIYGASDDLIEFAGAWEDEAGAYDGGTVQFDRDGIVPAFENVLHEPEAVRKWQEVQKRAVTVEALWCAEEGYSFTYKTDVPHATFEVVEDGEPYCRGIVIALEYLPA